MKRVFIMLCLLSVVGQEAEAQIARSRNPAPMIREVANHFQAPAGILYGMWRKESDLLLYGWKLNGRDWFLARSLVASGGKCIAEYGAERCIKHWRALVAICNQTRRNGSKVCDPNHVYTSYALAMGPTQHMPGELIEWVKRADGTTGWQWTKDAVDADGDGIVDPHSLADALSMTAIQLIRYRAQAPNGSWHWAVNRYYGSQRAAYFDGRWERSPNGKRRYRFGVREHWQAWCAKFGCNTRQPLAMR